MLALSIKKIIIIERAAVILLETTVISLTESNVVVYLFCITLSRYYSWKSTSLKKQRKYFFYLHQKT